MMFERLTQERWIGDRKRWVAFDAICLDDGIVGKAINRLAAYEDSGLSPEEVHKLVKVLEQAIRVKMEFNKNRPYKHGKKF